MCPEDTLLILLIIPIGEAFVLLVFVWCFVFIFIFPQKSLPFCFLIFYRLTSCKLTLIVVLFYHFSQHHLQLVNKTCWFLSPYWLSFFIFFNWRVIALQFCVRFCCTAKWVSFMCTHIFSLRPSHPSPLRHYRASIWAPCAIHSFPLAICFTHGRVYASVSIS